MKWLVPAFSEWIAILLLFTIGFTAHNLVVWILVTIVLGSRQHALGVLGHDSAHFAASDNRTLNDISSELLCFWPLITGLADFRQFHLNHHRYFNTEKDPELLFKNHWSWRQWRLPMQRQQIVILFTLDLLGFGVIEVIKAYWLLGKSCLRSWIGPAAWWGIVGSILFMSGLGFAIVIWFAALLTSFWGFFRLRTWTEHVGSESTHRMDANWWQRILITPHCSWSHYEHHEYPAVPFWQRHQLRGADAKTVTMGELFSSFASKDSSRELSVVKQTCP